MPSCAIITCRARSQVPSTTNERISFHKFPKEPDIKEKWIDVTGRENWFPTKTSTICSKHFKENDYSVKKSGFRYLRDGAIPSENVVRILSSELGMDFDTEKFITEVQSRPAIWKYNDKIQRYLDWKNLAESYGAQGDEVKQLAIRLQKKWKNIRDCFVKTHKIRTGKATARQRKIEYTHYENLLFLLDSECLTSIYDETNSVDAQSNTDLDTPLNVPLDTTSISDDGSAMSAFEIKIEPTENDPLCSNDSWAAKRREENRQDDDTNSKRKRYELNREDDDVRLFFLSLEKEFVKIPEQKRIQAKIDILKVIMDAQFSGFT